ncbi:MAG: ribosome biogenesis GTPase Der, partial [Cyclobacteriaceae bacterium]
NKADNFDRSLMAGEFYELSLGEVIPVSSMTGSGTGELLDKVITHFETSDPENPEEGIPKIAIMGRPNVGKSSFLNLLVGDVRSIVTDEAGTTRDSINTHYKLFGKDFILTDTAGVRKKSKVRENIEFYSVLRSIQSLQNSDVCIIMVDAERGLESQDINLISLAHRYRKGMMIMINKWDLIEKDTGTAHRYQKEIEARLGPLSYIPIVFTSVLEKQRVFKAIEIAMEVHENRSKRVSTSELNNTLLPEISRFPPPSTRGRHINIKYITQLPTYTPTFAFFCNHPDQIKQPYERFLENKLRSYYDFKGVPINIVFKSK